MAAFGADIDPAIYPERIWPKLAGVKLSAIMEASGYSTGCSRAGTWTPNVSTWPALARLVGLDLAELEAPGALAETAQLASTSIPSRARSVRLVP